ncbi:MAG TPA: deoxyribose-phosphate aldolase [Victivallales bacterium]|nr:deoxyribose-phosphate aldolase [Victivallales bacterium]
MSITNPKEVAKYIDHTVLKADSTVADVEKICKEADEYQFASVCINPYYVPLACSLLIDSAVNVCTVVGFPLGATTKESKAMEAIKAVADGADEVDMVLNVSAMKSGNYDYVEEDVRLVVNSVPEYICVKVILETCYLTDEEIAKASELSMNAGADFVKTSTGFGTGGATVEAVKIMKSVVGDKLEIKASGAVRDFKTAVAMIDAGATRLGTSSGIAIVAGSASTSDY